MDIKKEKVMSKEEELMERRYLALCEYKSGVRMNQIRRKYGIDLYTLVLLEERYNRYGMDGLKNIASSVRYTDEMSANIMYEYEEKGLSLMELSRKYLIHISTLKRWIPKYERYKKGDRYAFTHGKIYTSFIQNVVNVASCHPESKPMEETSKRKERRKELSKMSKEELYELLLDRECELELLKKVDALVKKREARLRAIGRRSSRD